jgi:tripartite-type tricarboxylate transporter receptor subunit TctC
LRAPAASSSRSSVIAFEPRIKRAFLQQEVAMRLKPTMWGAMLGASCLAALGPAPPAAAQDFYAGRQIKLTVGTGVGGGSDLYSRFLARYLPQHIAGHPTIVVVNMNGADSIVAANYIANRAPGDGSEILNVTPSLPMVQAFGNPNIKFDLAAFHWIGNMSESANVFIAWHTAAVKTIADARREALTIGSTDAASISSLTPIALNNLLGTKFRVVNGYQSGGAIDLAVERGEVDGRGSVTWASLKGTHPDWIRDKKINVLVQLGVAHDRDLPTVPLLSDLVTGGDDMAVAKFLDGMSAVARTFSVGPKVPGDRVAILRRAFTDTLNDPAVLAEAAKAQLDISPMDGETLQALVTGMVHANPAVIGRIKASFGR